MNLEAISIARKRSYPPRVSAFTQPFWQGLQMRRWQTTCCDACGKFSFPPKPVCPHCWSEKVSWQALSTRGTLYSWTRIHFAPSAFVPEAPFAVGIVDLEVGLRLATRVIDAPGHALTPGIPVDMVALLYEDGPLFAARPR